MNARDAEKLFAMPRRKRKVEDYYAGVISGDETERFKKDLKWGFGFDVKTGDVICAFVLRPTKEERQSK